MRLFLQYYDSLPPMQRAALCAIPAAIVCWGLIVAALVIAP